MAASSISSSMAVDLATVQPADILSRPANTCLLLCDVQHKIMDGTFKDKDRTPVLAQMRKVLDACRAAEVRTGYVVVRFRAGESICRMARLKLEHIFQIAQNLRSTRLCVCVCCGARVGGRGRALV